MYEVSLRLSLFLCLGPWFSKRDTSWLGENNNQPYHRHQYHLWRRLPLRLFCQMDVVVDINRLTSCACRIFLVGNGDSAGLMSE